MVAERSFFSGVVESLEEEESSSSYSDLTPRDIKKIQCAAVDGGNQHAEEMDQVEDITAITALHVFTSEIVVANVTPVSATVGEEIQDDGHLAEVTPPSLAMTSQMVARNPPPLAFLAPEFPPDSQPSAPLPPEVAEAVDRVGIIPRPDGLEVSVPPLRAPTLATDRADRREGGSIYKKEPKLKKRKDKE